jgi:hypothetical protein
VSGGGRCAMDVSDTRTRNIANIANMPPTITPTVAPTSGPTVTAGPAGLRCIHYLLVA